MTNKEWLEEAARLISNYRASDDCISPDRHKCDEWMAEYHHLMSDRTHRIRFTNQGWTIEHNLAERVTPGALFDCPANWTDGDVGLRGDFLLTQDEDGEWVVGEQVA